MATSMNNASSQEVSDAPAQGLWNGKIFDGQWRDASGGTQNVLEKATGTTLATIGIASADDVARAALTARKAQIAWAATPEPQRAQVLRTFARLVEEHTSELAEWIVRETGSVMGKAHFEIFLTIGDTHEAAALATQPKGHLLASTSGRQSIAKRVPLGVVGVITPWNSPLILAIRAAAPALALGNAVLLKPDVQTPVSGGALIAQLFEEAGLPPGVLHILPGDAETGEALVLDRNVNMISFTGSTAVGRRVGELAGRGLKRVSLELGGNNAYIVLDDADVEKAVAAGAFGSYFFQGQICFTAGRHLVHERVADRYIELLKARTRDLRVGDPFRDQVDLGPMINERQAARVERIVQESVAAGAILAVGGRREGLFFEPTVMTAVTPEMPVFKEEIFGPVAPVTVFHSDDEAVELANMTEYGLVASVQSASPTRALRIANQLHTAMVHINDQTINHEAYSPVGGMGASGNGSRFGALSNGDEFTQWQWVTINEEIPPYAFR